MSPSAVRDVAEKLAAAFRTFTFEESFEESLAAVRRGVRTGVLVGHGRTALKEIHAELIEMDPRLGAKPN